MITANDIRWYWKLDDVVFWSIFANRNWIETVVFYAIGMKVCILNELKLNELHLKSEPHPGEEERVCCYCWLQTETSCWAVPHQLKHGIHSHNTHTPEHQQRGCWSSWRPTDPERGDRTTQSQWRARESASTLGCCNRLSRPSSSAFSSQCHTQFCSDWWSSKSPKSQE